MCQSPAESNSAMLHLRLLQHCPDHGCNSIWRHLAHEKQVALQSHGPASFQEGELHIKHSDMQVREAGEEAWLGKAAPEVAELDYPPEMTHGDTSAPMAAIGLSQPINQASGSSQLTITPATKFHALLATGRLLPAVPALRCFEAVLIVPSMPGFQTLPDLHSFAAISHPFGVCSVKGTTTNNRCTRWAGNMSHAGCMPLS